MNYITALQRLHQAHKPNSYLEIGCRKGASLDLATCPRIAIDPDPEITTALSWPTRIYRETSDAFFQRPDSHLLLGSPPDLVFIDGMHLVEYALRDFINVEAHAHPGTVIVIDDVAPDDMSWASRERQTQAWTGDVYRLIPLLRHYRPDLEIQVFDAKIADFGKGLAIISQVDPNNRVLSEAYDEIAAKLEDGAFCESSATELRQTLQVQPSQQWETHIASLPRCSAESQLEERLLALTKSALLNEFYREDEFRMLYLRRCLAGDAQFDRATYLDLKGHEPEGYAAYEAACHEGRPYENKLTNLAFTHTMVGRLRLDSLHECLDLIRRNNIPGDLIECGVWRGGAGIFMASYLDAYRMTGRRLLMADSYEGLPISSHEKDLPFKLSKDIVPELAIPLETVKANFAAYNLLDERVTFLKGWFKDTLHDAPTNQIALLRMDGDLYESTMDTLTALYDKVSPGGIVVVDDYGVLAVCRHALEDFFAERNQPVPELTHIDWTGVYFVKPNV